MFLKGFYYFNIELCVSVLICVWICACASRCPQRPEEGVRASGAGVTGDCEPPEALGTKLGPLQKL